VIPIGEIPYSKSWYEEDESRIKTSKRYASNNPEIDKAIMAMK
jgi:hypothetical protein|tara:strand:- start:234 stop:362 length:129 start_codon:yes stop_codon:yes gene_type:complete